MKEYIKPVIFSEEVVMVSILADSIEMGVSDDSADMGADVLGKDENGFGNLW